MFTGLIEAVGNVQDIATSEAGSRLVIHVPDAAFLADAKLGDSIAIDGACTTVIALDTHHFNIEATPETLSKTTFGYFEPGRRVNLERPLLPTSRLGGHFVSGHVDGTASILAKYQEGNSWIYKFLLDQPELAAYLIPKGSITVNGISLTVNTVEKQTFTVAIIPHTLSHTNLDDFSPGGDGRFDTVNIECDILGKYVQKLLGASLGQAGGQALPANAQSAFQANTSGDVSASEKGKLFAGLWFNHDETIHGEYPGSDPSDVMHWPENPHRRS